MENEIINSPLKPSCTELYDSLASDFASRLHGIIEREKLLSGGQKDEPVINFKQPDELKKLFNFEIDEGGASNNQLLTSCEEIIKYSVKTGSTKFYNQLYGAADPYGIAAAWLTEALNTNEHTFEVAPVFVLMTHHIIKKLNDLIGYQNGDGIFCPGGSMANIMAMAMARMSHDKDIKSNGLFGHKRLVMFASEDSHYSCSKGTALLGLGTEGLIPVGTDEKGSMCPEMLKRKVSDEINKGHVPVGVVATSGSTVLGAYDDLESISHICKQNDMWLHVDACWGGGVMFSPTHKHLLNGVELSDSFCISLHKMMGAPLQCVPLLTKHSGLLQTTFGAGASYLFQQDKCYDVSYDLGDKTIQCGRKADSMKFWLMWKTRGNKGMAQHVDHAFAMADYFAQRLQETPGFRLVLPEYECTNVGFWYIPPSMRGEEETPEWWQRLHLVAPKIKEQMQLNGSMLIGYQPLKSKGFVNFFRIIIENPRLTKQDLDNVIEHIIQYGEDC